MKVSLAEGAATKPFTVRTLPVEAVMFEALPLRFPEVNTTIRPTQKLAALDVRVVVNSVSVPAVTEPS